MNHRAWRMGKRMAYLCAVTILFCMLFIDRKSLERNKENTLSLKAYMLLAIEDRAVEEFVPALSKNRMDGCGEQGISLYDVICQGYWPLLDWIRHEAISDLLAKKWSGREDLSESTVDTDYWEKEDLIESLKAENAQIDFGQDRGYEPIDSGFLKQQTPTMYDLKTLADYNKLVSEFYTIDSTTYIGRDQLCLEQLLKKDMTLKQRDSEKPQILIYHTHSQEAYADSVPGDETMTVMGIGEHLADILRTEYGYQVLHHTGKYDVESRDYAYSNAAPALEQILELYPDIEVIIDLHRDEVPPESHLVTDIQGKQMAKFMFFNGLSRTNKTGEIEYLKNENLEENLAFSFQMQLAANEYYPGITRKIYLKGYRYNMQYRGKTLLIELGAQNNRFEEAWNACDVLAHVLSIVLK